ncbi:endonuclease/exonuclease/phosphatase family protein [Reichenbachiella agarivorans]|uniref:Endonuclease/exonuclease/phosphatase family protein n=1 Tax=Reichenbachiella agarivorans TaxID=2979464 RepID=A0ABY6CQH2_9BACT|nr:endonuclease/exonuclease/phosphatase family protein [Reichenbachiella agarivorans]UXP31603.1 endonuclease/exonuclease/phosphatase family protein [Reichenbachiella agarivorans]
MEIALIILSYMLSILGFFPAFGITHWTFRVFDYIRIQLVVIQLLILGLSFFLYEVYDITTIGSQIVLILSIIYQLVIIVPYLPISFRSKKQQDTATQMSIISVNVLQKNKEYQRLISLIENTKPDIVLTMETNQDWEDALKSIDHQYKYSCKVPLENRYGMHFFTNLKVNKVKKHFFVSDDRPAIEAHLVSKNNHDFVFWGIHPPPPSPTEQPTSRQKDAEMMMVAKMIRESNFPNLVTGDFNNVCWSRSSKLFSKISTLNDSRVGKGIHGTFPVRPSICRFPIDLLFNSKEIEIIELKTLSEIGSDHLPIFAKFTVNSSSFHTTKSMDSELKEEANDIIKEGHKAAEEEEEA